jgi:hypothetical protein
MLCLSDTKQGRDNLEDDELTNQPRTVRTELKIQEVSTLSCANYSQMVDEVAAARISHVKSKVKVKLFL